MNKYENLGFFDFEDFVEELNEEQLFCVNGGSCGSGGSNSNNSGNTSTNTKTTNTNTSYTPKYSGSCSGGGAVTPSSTSNCNGGYNTSKPAITYKSEKSAKWKYVTVEGVGLNGTSVFTTNAGLNTKGKIEVTALGYFIGKNLVDTSSFFGSVSLVVDGKVVETKDYGKDTSAAIWDASYDRIGKVTFDYNISNSNSVQIISDVDLRIGSNGVGNTIINYTPTTVVLR